MAKVIPFIKRRFWWLVIALGIPVILILGRATSNTAPVAVAQSTIQRGDVEQVLIFSGEIEASDQASLSFQSPGTLSSLGVSEGELVTKGQFLGKLDTIQLNSVYQRANADYRAAQATVDRIYDELKGKGTSESFEEREDRTSAEVAKDKAYESMVSAQKALRDASMYSPIDGIVTSVNVETVGANVGIAVPQFVIVNPSSVYFSVTVDQTELSQVKPGQAVDITLDAFQDREIRGVIDSVSFAPKPDEAETLYEVKVQITGNLSDVHLGMTGDMEILEHKAMNVLWVEPQYVKSDAQGSYLLVGKDKKRVNIEVGLEGEERVEIKFGEVKEGESVHD